VVNIVLSTEAWVCSSAAGLSRNEIFDQVWGAAQAALGENQSSPRPDRASTPIPHLSESWYC
jgi:hypothetical protein